MNSSYRKCMRTYDASKRARARAEAAVRAAPPRRALRRARCGRTSPCPNPGSCGNRVPDVEEIEPLCRMLAHDALQHGDPGARGLLLAAAGHPHGLEHLDQVPIVRAEKAERRHHRHADGAGEE